MNFRLTHIFGLVFLVALFLAQRSMWLSTGKDFVAVMTPVSLTVMTAFLMSWARDSNRRILVASSIVALISSAALTIERAITTLGKFSGSYTAIQAISAEVLSQAAVATAVGIVAGLVIKEYVFDESQTNGR